MSEYVSDALVTLGGGTDKQGIILPRALARIEGAVDLYHQHEAPRIIAVGGYWLLENDSGKSIASEATQMENYAISHGVPERDILKAGINSRETIGNALFTKQELLEPNNWKNIDVVTSTTHLPRSLMAFWHVLGPDYTVKGIETPEKWILPKRAYEVLGLMMQRYVLDGTEPGDDEAIRARLFERVPGYDNGVTPQQLATKSILHALSTSEAAFYAVTSKV